LIAGYAWIGDCGLVTPGWWRHPGATCWYTRQAQSDPVVPAASLAPWLGWPWRPSNPSSNSMRFEGNKRFNRCQKIYVVALQTCASVCTNCYIGRFEDLKAQNFLAWSWYCKIEVTLALAPGHSWYGLPPRSLPIVLEWSFHYRFRVVSVLSRCSPFSKILTTIVFSVSVYKVLVSQRRDYKWNVSALDENSPL
jgi:hypothetical protein